jgi:hypothetical protein
MLAVAVLSGCKTPRKIRVRHSSAPAAVEPDTEPLPPPVHPLTPPTAAAVPPPTRKPRPVEEVKEKEPEKPSLCGRGPGERFAVSGVDASDTLNVRSEPDPQAEVLGQLPAGTSGVRAAGQRRVIGKSSWREVECGTVRGWVNERFLAREQAR